MENNRRGNRVAEQPGGIIAGAGSGSAVKEPVSARPLPPTWFQHGPQNRAQGCEVISIQKSFRSTGFDWV